MRVTSKGVEKRGKKKYLGLLRLQKPFQRKVSRGGHGKGKTGDSWVEMEGHKKKQVKKMPKTTKQRRGPEGVVIFQQRTGRRGFLQSF